MIATDLANLGEALHLNGSRDEAESLLREAAGLSESLGDPGGQAFALCQLGLLLLDRGDLVEARASLAESLRLRWIAGERGAMADSLEALAEASQLSGDRDLAVRLMRSADQLRDETGVVRQPVYEERHRRVLESLGDDAGSMAAADADSVVAAVLSELGPVLSEKTTTA
jgi:tetratricopeptide (TPR) repeat protein